MKILLLGANGQVGFELSSLLETLGSVRAMTRVQLDLTDADSIREELGAWSPSLIVNAAAYTAVDQAESEEGLAMAINADAPAHLARWAAANEAGLVHYSTDYVFDGTADAPLGEGAPSRPLGVYGRSKWAGEEAIRDSGCRHLILRTSWVYGNRGKNFLRSILALAAERETLRIVDDQWGTPTWSRALAGSTAVALARLRSEGDWADLGGTYHLSSRGQTTWYRFGRRFLEMAVELGLLRRVPNLEPIATSDWPTPAPRPAWSVLDNSRFESRFGVMVMPWEDQLQACMTSLAATAAPDDVDAH